MLESVTVPAMSFRRGQPQLIDGSGPRKRYRRTASGPLAGAATVASDSWRIELEGDRRTERRG